MLLVELSALPRKIELSKWELRKVPDVCSGYMNELIEDTDKAWIELQSMVSGLRSIER